MEIDDEIASIENSLEVIKGKSLPDTIKDQSKEVDITDETEVATHMLKMIEADRKKADEIFDLFYKDLELQKDRSTSSKETLARALELKIEASKSLLEMIKVKQKQKEQKGSIGIVLNTVNEKKMGINISGINLDETE